MGAKQIVSNEEILRAYTETGSVKLAGEKLGINGASVHERLVRMGKNRKLNVLSVEDEKVLRERYQFHRDSGTLHILAKQLGRTKQFLCRKARGLGLTDAKGPRLWNRVWMDMPEEQARALMDNFKTSPLTLGQFCAKHGYDDLGFSRTMRKFFPDEYEHVIEAKAPKQTMYRLGRQVEYSVRDDLKKRGFPVVMRSPKSGSAADLIAIKRGQVLLVQCKRSLQIGVKDWNDIYDMAQSVGAISVLAGRPTGRGLQYFRMMERKDGTRRSQPMVEFQP